MIRLVIDNGVQTITERCDDCGCHVRNLTIDDILVKKNNDMIVKNSKGEEVTNTENPRPTCTCEHCS